MNPKSIVLIVYIILSISFKIKSQSYEIVYYKSKYDTLINYKSVNLDLAFEGEFPYIWDKSFEFGFDFPFYDSTYNKVIIDNDAVGIFPNSPNYNFDLFSGYYTIDKILDTVYLFSEVRYSSLIEDSLKVFVLEYHNVYNADELEENGTNHIINFQLKFYENGIIELHFGKINLSNCSYYFPGKGFSFDNSDPTDNIYGPWIGINNNDESQSAYFQGNHDDPVIIYDNIDSSNVVTSIPPEGFVVKFIPSKLSSNKKINILSNKYWIYQYNNEIEIRGNINDYIFSEIIDVSGRKIAKFFDNHYILPDFYLQILILKIKHKHGYEIHKIISKY